MKSTNYYNTFIEVAEDCPVASAEVPPLKGNDKTVANLQFEMVQNRPYHYTSDEVLFGVYAAKNNLPAEELATEREKFFSKGQACLRASPLTKRYGWGVHANEEGKIALFALESAEYEKLSEDKALKVVKAMRSKRG
ncbi:hypothetical protein EFA69_06760 [Rufibacter immobilis]|uniref:Uncharacterized protein n=1 Tax=Rufibacter immobilis TaxID=1348778 RepID=A0A3M9MZ21_9BACT|nr:DUF6157 family protein [Rufibacter immobilis]RNI30802.1 hypothetical protein EFA69_06760 [Rufibacter immobilis]